MDILFIPGLHGQVFERKCRTFRKAYCGEQSEKMINKSIFGKKMKEQ
jgi:hypothetical protein